nr:hypothetical protein [Streptacidiphilus jiangxiensis]
MQCAARNRAEELEIHKTDSGQGVPSTDETDPVARTAATAVPSPTSVAAAPRPGPRPGPPARRPVPGPPAGPTRSAKPGSPARRSADALPTLPELQLLPAAPDTALDRADEAVDLLLDAGRAPGQILVLTTDAAHPWQQHEQSFGAERYWAQLEAGDDVFYASAQDCRATRREAVVLAVNGGDTSTVQDALAVALARATTLLIVCGETPLPAQR